jgi:type VI secretion system protein VasD
MPSAPRHVWLRGAAACMAFGTGLLWAAAPVAAADPAPAAAATVVELTVVGGPDINPNAAGRASPVVVRIFDLATAGSFEAAGYAALFEQPDADLKRAIVAQEEFVLRPGDIQEHDRTLPPQVVTLGVAAAFRDLEHAQWRLTIPVKPGRRNFLLIHLDHNSIRVDPVDAGRP